jgi:hypothetical protein
MQYFVCVCVCKDLHHKLFHISGRSMGLQHTDARNLRENSQYLMANLSDQYGQWLHAVCTLSFEETLL